MSRVIDQQVVEMQFDNSHFERNVRTSMSTIDKLKQSLNLTGASKGLENINEAAKKNNFGVLGQSVDQVKVKFSAMQIAGITALTNITNSAVNAGKRIVKALTIDPVTTGFNEYELKMGAIQTIMSSTGESLETVTKYLNELNEYSDKTIYSFSDMTQNIGKFTNAGVSLEDAVLAMKGISNEAALSGANANEASRAMYNLSQALSMGYVQYIDWKSIENANMATVSFKQQLLDTAVQLGVVKKVGDDTYTTLEGKSYSMMQMFKDAMSDQWMTSDVLIETLKDYADETTEIGSKAYKAATEIKTFTQMLDTLKESAQSGWAQTWETIFGSFYEARDLWTDLGGGIGKLIDGMADSRNNMLKTALGSSWEELTDQIEEAGYSAGKFSKVLREVMVDAGRPVEKLEEEYGDLSVAIKAGKVNANDIRKALDKVIKTEKEAADATGEVNVSLEKLQKIADKVIDGAFSNGEKRIKALTEAGYDYASVQNLVNELLGSSVRHVSELTEEQKAQLSTYANMTDAQKKNANLSKEQTDALSKLKAMAEATGGSVNDLISDLERPSGRMLLLESFKNIWEEILKILDTVAEAWVNVFGEDSDIKAGEGLYKLIEDFHKFTEGLEVSEDSLRSFKAVLEAVFNVSSLSFKILGKSLLAALTLLNAVLGLFGTNILSLAESIANKISGVVTWLNEEFLFGYKHTANLAKLIETALRGIGNVIDSFLNLDAVSAAMGHLKELLRDLFDVDSLQGVADAISTTGLVAKVEEIFKAIDTWVQGLNTSQDLVKSILGGIVYGFEWTLDGLLGISESIGSAIIKIVAALFGLDPTSVLAGWSAAFDTLRRIGSIIKECVVAFAQLPAVQQIIQDFKTNIENAWNTLINTFGSGGNLNINTFLEKIENAFSKVKKWIEGLKDLKPEELGTHIISGLAKGITEGIGLVISTITNIATTLINTFCSLLGINSPSRVMIALGGFIIAGLIAGLTQNGGEVGKFVSDFGTNVIGWFKNMFESVINFAKQIDFGKVMAITFGAGLLYTVKKLADAIALFGSPLDALAGLLKAGKKALEGLGSVFDAIKDAVKLRSRTEAIKSIAISLLVLAGALWVVSQIEEGKLLKSVAAIGALAVIMYLLSKACEKMNKIDGIGFNYMSIVAIAGTFLAMAVAFKLLASIDPEQLQTTLIGFAGVVVGLLALVKGISTSAKGIDKFDFKGLGRTMLKMAIALLLMAGVIKLMAGLKVTEVLEAGIYIAAIAGLFKLFSMALSFKGLDDKKISEAGWMCLKLSAALLIMIAVIKLAAGISLVDALKGAAVITVIGGLFAGMIWLSNLIGKADDTKIGGIQSTGNLILKFATSLLLIAVSIRILASLSVGELAKATATIYAIGALCAALIGISIFSGVNANKAGLMLIEFAASLLIISAVILLLKEICKDPEGLTTALGVITWLGVIMGALIAVTRFAGEFADIKGTLITLTVAIGILAVAIVALSLLDTKKVAVAGAVLSAVIGMFALLVKATSTISTTGKELLSAVGMLALLVGVTVILTFIIREVANLDPDRALASAKALGILLLSLSASIWMLGHLKGLNPADLVTALACVGILSLLCIYLATLLRDISIVDPAKAIPTAIAIGVLLLALSASFKIIASGTGANILTVDDVIAAGAIIGLLSVAILALAATIKILENVKPANAIGAAVAIGILLLALTASFSVITGTAGATILTTDDVINIAATLLVMTIAIGAMAAVIKALENVNPANAIGNAIALGILILALSIAILPLTAAGSFGWSAVKGALALTAMAIPLATLAYTMSNMPIIPVGVIDMMDDLVKLMVAMTALMIPLAVIGKLSSGTDLLIGIAALTGMVVPLGLLGWAIAELPPLGNKVPTINALTELLYSMTSLLVPLAAIGAIVGLGGLIGAASIGAGIAALTLMIVPLCTFGHHIKELPLLDGHIPTIVALTNVLEKMTDLLIKATLISPLALLGVLAIDAIVETVLEFGALVVAIGGLMAMFEKYGIDSFVDKGIGTLVKLSEGLGEVMGAMITGFGDKVMGQLPFYGEKLSEFIDNAKSFLDGVQEVGSNNTLATGAKNISDAVLKLLTAEFINSYMDVMSLGTYKLEDLGTELSNFINKAKPFFDTVGDIDSSAITGAKTIAETIQALSVASLTQVIADFFSYKPTDWAEFGEKLANFGGAMAQFNESIKGQTFDQEAIDCVKQTAEIMTALQQSLNPIGGVISFFCGEQDLGNFGDQIRLFGEGIKAFSDSVTGGLDTKAMNEAASMGDTMAQLQSSIEPVYGLVEAFTGTTNLSVFGSHIKSYATALKEACNAFKDDNGNVALDPSALEKAKEVGLKLAELQAAIPTDKWFDGKISLSEFGKDIEYFGYYLKAYSSYLTDVDEAKMTRSTGWAKTLVQVANDVASINTEGINNISKIKELGSTIRDFASDMTEFVETDFNASGIVMNIISSISTAFSGSTEKLKNIGSDVITHLVSGLKVNDESVADKASKIVAAIIKKLKGEKEKFKDAGKEFLDYLKKGLSDLIKKNEVSDAAKAVAINAADNGIKQSTVYEKYKAAGKYCVQGFRDGISLNSYIAKTAAANMATSAADAANAALQINSPSKVFMRTGSGVVEGFVKGIRDNASAVVHSATDMADTARSGFSNAIGRITDLLNGEMETQPTIRPVLDLSNVQAGASTIGSMFGNPSIGVMSNLGSINTLMNRRNQNGPNDDVVGAINRLESVLGSLGGDSYTIGGITYDDGSAVSDAVKSLIRAANIGRRV